MRVVVPLLIVVAVVVGGLFLWQRQRGRAAVGPKAGRAPGAASATTRGDAGAAPLRAGLSADLSRWVGAGLISAEQADAIASHERASVGALGAPPEERRVSLLAEALGYVGVALALAGAAAGLAQGWESIPVWGRITIPAATTGLLVLGGFFLRRQEELAFRRLMSVLWVLAVGGMAWTLAVVGIEATGFDAEPIALMAAGGCTLLAAGLYLACRHGLQQAALLASLHALAVSALLCVAEPRRGWWFAATIWALGAAWAVLGWRRLLAPEWLAIAFGCAGMVIGPAFGLNEYEWLLAPALLTTASLVAVSVPTRQTPLLALGMVGAFGYITWAVLHYFSDSLGPPLALVIVGAVFLVLAVLAGVLANRGKSRAGAPAA
jgi:hypothetical protein